MITFFPSPRNKENEALLKDWHICIKSIHRKEIMMKEPYSFKHFDFLQLQRLQPSLSPPFSDFRLRIATSKDAQLIT